MAFRRYDHVERLGHENVQGITLGDVYVFPKLDGTNASVWFYGSEWSNTEVCCASRTRQLSDTADNAGFWQWAHTPEAENKLLEVAKSGGHNWIIYGEWLVPHTLKTYREDAWRRFYVFDVYDTSKGKYLSYEEFEPTIRAAGLDIIEPLCIITNPSDEQLQKEAELNTYLILDGAGCGEGIVIKNYLWNNHVGKQPWAKIVRNEFKEKNRRAFGTTEKGGEYQVEAAIAEEFVTFHTVDKTRQKIVNELTEQDIAEGKEPRLPLSISDESYIHDAMDRAKRVEERHRGQLIPRLLGTVYFDVVSQDLWEAVKKHKDPTIDFKKLKAHCIMWTKKHAGDLF